MADRGRVRPDGPHAVPAAPRAGRGARSRGAARSLARLDLDELAERTLGTLSGGERQRVVVARALAQEASIVLLDEPTASLDIGHQQQALDLLDVLRDTEGLTLVAAMHDLTLAAQYADRVLLLDAGRLVADGAPPTSSPRRRSLGTDGARVRVVALDDTGSRCCPRAPAPCSRSRRGAAVSSDAARDRGWLDDAGVMPDDDAHRPSRDGDRVRAARPRDGDGSAGEAAIHRGTDAPIGTYRFMVSLRLAGTPDAPRCGGTLIAPDIVLTAGHCVGNVPQGGLVAVVGADVVDWPTAPRVATLGHRTPDGFDLRLDNRHDIARSSASRCPRRRRASAWHEPSRVPGARVVTAGWGCTNAPPACIVHPTRLQASDQVVLRDAACGQDVFFVRPTYYDRTTICTKGARPRSTVNHGDSGGPLLVRDAGGGLRQVGVTSLGADSKVKLYAGFTSIPIERRWIATAIASLRG